jgi:hypothetical protein
MMKYGNHGFHRNRNEEAALAGLKLWSIGFSLADIAPGETMAREKSILR